MKTSTDITQATAGAIGRLALMLVTALVLTLAAPVMSAETTDSVAVRVLFPKGSSVVNPGFADNAKALRGLADALAGKEVISVTVSGKASPDGTSGLNQRLSHDRAANLAAWLQTTLGIPASVITITSKGIDWEGLEVAVEASDMQYRDEVLDILRNIPETTTDSQGRLVDSRKKHLMDLHGGLPYGYMLQNIFPSLRATDAEAICTFKVGTLPACDPTKSTTEQPAPSEAECPLVGSTACASPTPPAAESCA